MTTSRTTAITCNQAAAAQCCGSLMGDSFVSQPLQPKTRPAATPFHDRLRNQYGQSMHVDATLIRRRCKWVAGEQTAGPAESKNPTGGCNATVDFTWRGAVFWRPFPMKGRAAWQLPPATICRGATKAVKVNTRGVKKTSTTRSARGTGSSFGLVLDAEGRADAGSDEARRPQFQRMETRWVSWFTSCSRC